ncbi:MAG: hypothetical protein AVDCRST_MAG38-2941, partial [uncultured Solirubrobacteraceae bacterium]
GSQQRASEVVPRGGGHRPSDRSPLAGPAGAIRRRAGLPPPRLAGPAARAVRLRDRSMGGDRARRSAGGRAALRARDEPADGHARGGTALLGPLPARGGRRGGWACPRRPRRHDRRERPRRRRSRRGAHDDPRAPGCLSAPVPPPRPPARRRSGGGGRALRQGPGPPRHRQGAPVGGDGRPSPRPSGARRLLRTAPAPSPRARRADPAEVVHPALRGALRRRPGVRLPRPLAAPDDRRGGVPVSWRDADLQVRGLGPRPPRQATQQRAVHGRHRVGMRERAAAARPRPHGLRQPRPAGVQAQLGSRGGAARLHLSAAARAARRRIAARVDGRRHPHAAARLRWARRDGALRALRL